MTISLLKTLDCVAKTYGVTVDDLIGISRKQPIAQARQMAMYVLLQNPRASMVQVGKLFNRQHSTVNGQSRFYDYG